MYDHVLVEGSKADTNKTVEGGNDSTKVNSPAPAAVAPAPAKPSSMRSGGGTTPRLETIPSSSTLMFDEGEGVRLIPIYLLFSVF